MTVQTSEDTIQPPTAHSLESETTLNSSHTPSSMTPETGHIPPLWALSDSSRQRSWGTRQMLNALDHTQAQERTQKGNSVAVVCSEGQACAAPVRGGDTLSSCSSMGMAAQVRQLWACLAIPWPHSGLFVGSGLWTAGIPWACQACPPRSVNQVSGCVDTSD